MQTNTQVLQRVLAEFPVDSSDSASRIDLAVNAEIVRSENNILQWMSYLPEDCVRTMINMGWDLTT